MEHEVDVIRHADWIVEVGPAAGQEGGEILYSGPLAGLKKVGGSQTLLGRCEIDYVIEYLSSCRKI